MPLIYNRLPTTVTLAGMQDGEFNGTFEWRGGVSYFEQRAQSHSHPHFTVLRGDQNVAILARLHITFNYNMRLKDQNYTDPEASKSGGLPPETVTIHVQYSIYGEGTAQDPMTLQFMGFDENYFRQIDASPRQKKWNTFWNHYGHQYHEAALAFFRAHVQEQGLQLNQNLVSRFPVQWFAEDANANLRIGDRTEVAPERFVIGANNQNRPGAAQQPQPNQGGANNQNRPGAPRPQPGRRQ